MKEFVITYFGKRISPAKFLGLLLFMILYSAGSFGNLNLFHILYSPLFLAFFIFMRIYDDYMSADIDCDKPGREYALPQNRVLFESFLLISFMLFLAFCLAVHWLFFMVFLVFLVLNHILYRALLNKENWRFYLPLFKYPFAAMVIAFFDGGLNPDIETTVICLALLPAFVVFESLDDSQLGLTFQVQLSLLIVAFGSLAFVGGTLYHALAVFVVMLLGILLVKWQHKSAAYLLLLLLLITRLSL